MTAEFLINSHSASGLKINRFDLVGERYTPYKGVKSTTKAGKFQIRS